MKSVRLLLLAAAVVGAFTAMPGSAQGKKAGPTVTGVAKALVTALSKGDYAGATRNFDDTMKKAMPVDTLKGVWEQIQAKVGKFKSQGAARTDKIQGYDVAYVLIQFEKSELECKVVENDKKQVSGLFFVPKGAK